MNDNEIIKALEEELKTALIINHRFEESNDTENPDDHRFIALLSSTIELINRQQAEIENYIKVAENQQNLTLKKSFEIKELKAEIERLKQNLEEAHIDIREHLSELKRFKKIETTVNGFWNGITKLAMFNDKETPTLEELLEYMDNLRTEAYKEFIERLKAKKHECGCNYRKKPVYAVTEEKIDETYKEMVGEDK